MSVWLGGIWVKLYGGECELRAWCELRKGRGRGQGKRTRGKLFKRDMSPQGSLVPVFNFDSRLLIFKICRCIIACISSLTSIFARSEDSREIKPLFPSFECFGRGGRIAMCAAS